MNWKRMSDNAIVNEIGTRIKKQRLLKNYSQEELASRAGIGISTLQKLEYGSYATLKTIIQVLRALKQLDALDSFIIDPGISPIELQKLEGKSRERASKRNSKYDHS